MPSPKYAITYLAYGLESSKYQAILSIYTILYHVEQQKDDFLFVIYTDSNHTILDKYLKGLPIKLEVLTKEQIVSFKGQDNYMFRIKPCIIGDYFEKYQQSLLYMDTDTFFLRDPTKLLERIKPGHTLMNAEEYNLVDGGDIEYMPWFTLRQGLKRNKYTVNGQQVTIPITTTMWNSGVVGISQVDSPLISQYISLLDEIYKQCKAFNVEQFAASYVLQLATELRSTEDYIEHYWSKDIKHTFNLRIPAFLRENAGKSGQELYTAAFEFAQKTKEISTPYREPFTSRIRTRLKLIMRVARKGHL